MKVILFSATVLFVACSGSQSTSEKTTESTTSAITADVPAEAVAKTTVQNVNVDVFNQKTKSNPGIILDVRTPEETGLGIIPGAVIINFYDADFKSQVDKLDKTKPVYVYCKAGGRSAQAAQILADKNFKEVYNLQGGYDAWSSK